MYVCARSLGSVLVGGLLGLAAMTLVNKNRELLVGTSVPPKRLEHVLSILESDPVVHSVHDVKAIMIGMSFPLPRRFLADFPSLFFTLYPPPPRMNSSSIKGYSVSAMLLSAFCCCAPHTRDSKPLVCVIVLVQARTGAGSRQRSNSTLRKLPFGA